MIPLVIQWSICYGLIGLILSGLLDVFSWGRDLSRFHRIIFFCFLLVWFPIAFLALLAAPFAALLRFQEQEEAG